MSEWTIQEVDGDREREVSSRSEAEDAKTEMEQLGMNVEIIPPAKSDGGNTPEETGSEINALAQNPIDWLRAENDDYVNTVKGTPAISKRGFRYIQSKFEITTESEVVQWVDDPTGVIIWAKAELPDGRSAEAHGEGWQFEGRVDDNEFVRYADTRAKNRALADLTSSGALATEELK